MPLIWKAKPGPEDVEEKKLRERVMKGRAIERLPSSNDVRHESMLINEVTLVLAEKRTALSVMRTGLAILALPISVLSVLIVISRYYDPLKVIYMLGPLLSICVALTILGGYMIIRSLKRISQLNKVVLALKKQNAVLRELCVAMNDLISPDHDF